MTKLITILISSFLFLTQVGISKEQTFKARVTYYTGSRVAWSKIRRPIEGISVAAHPRFKFGTKLYIHDLKGIIGDGNFIVHDRGPAVTRGSASKGNIPVIDVFVSSTTKINRMKTAVPDYIEVIVTE